MARCAAGARPETSQPEGARRDGVVFAPIDFVIKARIAAYSVEHVTPWIARLPQDLSAAARAALLPSHLNAALAANRS